MTKEIDIIERLPQFLSSQFNSDAIAHKVLATIPIYHQGWKMDEWAVLIELDDKSRHLIYTDHTKLYVVDGAKQFLEEQISVHHKAATKIKLGIDLL